MKFLLFSKISFNVSNHIALIESFCFQSDFYLNYDLLENKKIEDVNRIGARIKGSLMRECKAIIKNTNNLSIFNYDLDSFLLLNEKTRNGHIKELCKSIINELLKIKGIGLSKITKILYTLYPDLIPMIDKPLQELYREKINLQWTEEQASQILIDYYNNLKEEENWQNLTQISRILSKNNLMCLSKVRIFDILWWSYLKSEKLRDEKNINWSTIK